MRRGERRRGDEREREKVNERPTDRSDHWIRRFIHGADERGDGKVPKAKGRNNGDIISIPLASLSLPLFFRQ